LTSAVAASRPVVAVSIQIVTCGSRAAVAGLLAVVGHKFDVNLVAVVPASPTGALAVGQHVGACARCGSGYCGWHRCRSCGNCGWHCGRSSSRALVEGHQLLDICVRKSAPVAEVRRASVLASNSLLTVLRESFIVVVHHGVVVVGADQLSVGK